MRATTVTAVAAMLLALAMTATLAVAQSGPAPTPTTPTGPPARAMVCIFARWSTMTVHGHYAMQHYAPQFAGTRWDARVIRGTALRDMVQGYLSNGTDCDILAYAVSSSVAIAMSPLVPPSVAWLGASETSTELSDSEAHPSFNRVIPTDAVGAGSLAVLASNFGWTKAMVLCQDEPYGRSLAEGFTARFIASGGQIEASRCFAGNADAATIAEGLEIMLSSSDSRVLFVGASDAEFNKALVQVNAKERVALIFPEAGCSQDGQMTELFRGAFCMVYATVDAQRDPYNAAFQARDAAAQAAFFDGILDNSTVTGMSPATFWGGMAVDAMRAAMQAVHTFHSRNVTAYPTMAQWVRTQRFDGLTGAVSFDHNGDRGSATAAIYNVQPRPGDNATANDLVRIRLLNGDQMTRDATAYHSLDNAGFTDVAPSGLKPVPPETKPFPWWAIVIAVLVLAIIAFAVFRKVSTAMALARCPTDSTQPFTAMFVSVRNEDVVRTRHPQDCAKAFSRVMEIARREVRNNNCHEARRVDETTLMIVSKKSDDAIACASAILAAVESEKWEKTLRMVSVENEMSVRDDRSARSSRRSRKSGGATSTMRRSVRPGTHVSGGGRDDTTATSAPRNAIVPPELILGIHTATGDIDIDDRTGVISYHGPVIRVAAHVADAGVGNQIVVSEAAVDASNTNALDGAVHEFRRLVAGNIDLALYTFIPLSTSDEGSLLRRIEIALARRAASDDEAGGVAAALSQAESGFSKRRVAAVCAYIPALLNPDNKLSETEHSQRASQVIEEVQDAAKQHRAEVVSVADGRVLFVINARGPQVNQVDVRAAQIAHHLSLELPHLNITFRGTRCGIASGRCLVGGAHGVSATLGFSTTMARMMQQMASHLAVPALAADTNYDDLTALFTCSTIDAVSIPLTSAANGPKRTTRLLSLIEPCDRDADGEWLYNVGQGGIQETNDSDGKSKPGAALESIWAELVRNPSAAPKAAAELPATGTPTGVSAESLPAGEAAEMASRQNLEAAARSQTFEQYCLMRAAELRVCF